MIKEKMRLYLFGDGAAGGADGGNTGAAPAGDSGEMTQGTPASPAAEETKPSPEDKRKAFLDMAKGEYKDVYAQEVQKIIDRRFKDYKTKEDTWSKSKPVLDMLMQRYGIEDGDIGKLQSAVENDDAYWSEAADEAGMTTEQYKKFQKMQRENAELLRYQREQQAQQKANEQTAKWMAEAEAMKADYPDFDILAESENPDFASLISRGVPVRHAYEVVHLNDIKNNIGAQTARKVTDDIRARGLRPKENGTASQAAFTVKDDLSKLTLKDIKNYFKRAGEGEVITFRN